MPQARARKICKCNKAPKENKRNFALQHAEKITYNNWDNFGVSWWINQMIQKIGNRLTLNQEGEWE